jgi:tight adherence protein C
MIEFLIAAFAGVGVWLAISRRAKHRDKRLMSRISDLAAQTPTKKRPPATQLLAAAGRRLPGNRGVLRQSLASADLVHWSPDAVVSVRYLGVCAGILAGLAFGRLAPLASIALAFGGYRLPDLVINRRAKQRSDDIQRDLPDAIDLLAVCTHAGLNLSLSLKRVAAGIPGPLGAELRRTVGEIDLGVPRSKALEEMGSRNEVAELESLVGLLQTSERFGTKVAASLMTFGGDIRLKRKRRAEELARRAPVKMLFPLVFLILPGFVLLTLVPLLLSTFESLGF